MGRVKQTKAQVEAKLKKILEADGFINYYNSEKLAHKIKEYWGSLYAMQKALGIPAAKRGRPKNGKGAHMREESEASIRACLNCKRPACIGTCPEIRELS